MTNRSTVLAAALMTAVASGCGARLLVAENATPLPIPAEEALSRLAAVLWQSPPDAALLSRAAPGQITAVEDLHGVIDEMLADPRAANGVGAFYRWWLNLPALSSSSKDTTLYPTYTSELQADMALETETFGVEVTLAMNGSYMTLLTADFSFINARLADLYGVSGVAGDTLRQVTLPAGQRAGLLTQPALQALSSSDTHNSPPRRGTYITERFLCEKPVQPPPNVPTQPLAAPGPGLTLRQSLAAFEQQDTVCVTCHQAFDPAGLTFEGFDAIGRTRLLDNGAPVDVSNLELVVPPSTEPTGFDGPVELATLLANAPTAHDCFARKWLSFVVSRDLLSADETWLSRIDATFSAAGYDLKVLIAAVLTSGPFLTP